MLMSDMGADIIRVDRRSAASVNALAGTRFEIDGRGRRSLRVDLKSPAAVELCLDLIAQADIVMEGFRPGVMERLGLGPEIALARNPKLVYGRMTGWGQTGSYSKAAGHDLNYIAISGVLHAIGTKEAPVPPLNIIGDYGGAVMNVVGMLAALVHARGTGKGQVVDTAMSDAAAYLGSMFYGMHAAGTWKNEREANILDAGNPSYGVFRCADGKFISIASMEPQFYALLLEKTGLKLPEDREDRTQWPAARATIAALFAQKTRQEWCDLMENTDVCFAPVLSFEEAPSHHHNRSRQSFVEFNGVVQPAPTPRFSETPGQIQRPPPERDAPNDLGALKDWGLSESHIATLRETGVV
jgi:alpha-methylacyl-CoA racemase